MEILGSRYSLQTSIEIYIIIQLETNYKGDLVRNVFYIKNKYFRVPPILKLFFKFSVRKLRCLLGWGSDQSGVDPWRGEDSVITASVGVIMTRRVMCGGGGVADPQAGAGPRWSLLMSLLSSRHIVNCVTKTVFLHPDPEIMEIMSRWTELRV